MQKYLCTTLEGFGRYYKSSIAIDHHRSIDGLYWFMAFFAQDVLELDALEVKWDASYFHLNRKYSNPNRCLIGLSTLLLNCHLRKLVHEIAIRTAKYKVIYFSIKKNRYRNQQLQAHNPHFPLFKSNFQRVVMRRIFA